MLQRVVFLNADSRNCATASCDSVPPALRARANGAGVESCTPATINLAGPPPVILVARFSAVEHVPEAVAAARRAWRQTPVLGLICGGAGENGGSLLGLLDAVDDFLVCPFLEREALERIRRLIPAEGLPAHRGQGIREELQLEFLVGESRPFLDLVQMLPLLASSDAPVLITGETGTGKELFGRAIHYTSKRRARPFIPVNCGALPDLLFENELFGHSRGAYTGANTAGKGLIAAAEGGTLLLDEVDSLSPAAQVKLLRFLQDGEYRPLGSVQGLHADVRIIAATNADLRPKAGTSRIREDLFHRLNLLSIHLPALREREGDIGPLAEYMLQKYADQYERASLAFAPGVTRVLAGLSWPGNIRELEAAVHRAVVFAGDRTIRLEDLGLAAADDGQAAGGSLREAKSLRIAEFERVYLEEALQRTGGNVSRAARESGKDRRAFQRLLRKHGIEPVRG
jgi:DNA-binding NtrC family response regulator